MPNIREIAEWLNKLKHYRHGHYEVFGDPTADSGEK
jgi:hypothetical protein